MNETANEIRPVQGECCAKACVDDSSTYKMSYDVTIRQLDRGYIVNVGCKSFAFESQEIMLGMINEYVTNPNKIEHDFWNGTLFTKTK